MAEKEYIERKVIINKIVNTPTVPIRQCYEGNFVYADGVSGRQNEIIDYINEQPTADVAPVRHGRWVIIEILCGGGKERKYYRCSECNKANVIRSNYCGNCGARMDGDKND